MVCVRERERERGDETERRAVRDRESEKRTCVLIVFLFFRSITVDHLLMLTLSF